MEVTTAVLVSPGLNVRLVFQQKAAVRVQGDPRKQTLRVGRSPPTVLWSRGGRF